MNNSEKLLSLVATLEDQQARKRDWIVPAHKIMYEDGTINWPKQADDDLVVEEARLNDLALNQLTTFCKIPKEYVDMLRVDAPHLLATNINTLLRKKEDKRYLLRLHDDTCRAVLTDSYNCRDNYDMMTAILPAIQKLDATHGLSIHAADVTDRRLYLKMVSSMQTGEIRKGSPVENGVIIGNSETGHGAIFIRRYLRICVCDNGAIGEHAFRKVHLGKQAEAEGYLSIASRNLDDALFWSKLKDALLWAFDQDAFNEYLDKVRGVSETHLPKPAEAAQVVARLYSLPKQSLSAMTNAMIEAGDPTVWGLSNAITSLAHTLPNPDEAFEMQRIGGEILSFSPTKWGAIIRDSKRTSLSAAV